MLRCLVRISHLVVWISPLSTGLFNLTVLKTCQLIFIELEELLDTSQRVMLCYSCYLVNKSL